jgi:hypothetical protein
MDRDDLSHWSRLCEIINYSETTVAFTTGGTKFVFRLNKTILKT